MPRKPRLLAIGGAHIDRRGTMTAPFVPGASIPGVMREEIGGGAFNAAGNAVRHGIDVSLVSVRGGDEAGARVAAALASRGIEDLASVYLDRATPSYTALVTAEGDVVAALADMGLYDLALAKELRRAKAREAARGCDAVLFDANLPETAAEKAVALAGDKPAYALAISPAKAVRLRDVLSRLDLLFMNRREAAALCGAGPETDAGRLSAALRGTGLRGAVVTDGPNPVVAFRGEEVFGVLPPPVAAMADATGAGDALAGTVIAALLTGSPLAEAVRRGVAAAAITVTSQTAIAPYDARTFAETLAATGAPVFLERVES